MLRRLLFLLLLTALTLLAASCNLSGVQLPAPQEPAQTVPQTPTEAAPAQPAALPMEYVGVYTAQLPAADTPGRAVTVVLSKDGAVTVTSDYLNGAAPIVETGAWQADANGLVTAVLTAQDGQAFFEPVTFTVQLQGDQLLVTAQGQTEPVILLRSTGETAPAPTAETLPAPPTRPVTPTVVVTTTAPVTTTAVVTATTPVTPTVAAPIVIKNAYLGLRRTASGGGSALFALSLNDDGTVQYGTEFYNDQPAIIEVGTWVDNGDGTLTVTITGRADRQFAQPIVIKFVQEGDLLRAVEYDQNIFGSEGLTLRKAASVVNDIEQALVTLDIAAGFPLDPTFVSVNGGGEVDASLLGGGCTGFINDKPVVTVRWSGQADHIEAFFVSDHDPTLVVLTPDGRFLCNDDTNEQLLDPTIRIDNPPAGVYRIWVGSYAKGQLLPGVLVMTTKPEVNIGTFNLGGLIRRPPVAKEVPEPTPSVDTSIITQTLQSELKPAATLQAGAAPVVHEMTAEGSLPAFELPVVGARCGGFIANMPDYVFSWQGEPGTLRILFEGNRDSTLLVVTPTGRILCADDVEAGVNVNPMVEVLDANPGPYLVFVGRLDPATPVSGRLIVTTAADALPAPLGPQQ